MKAGKICAGQVFALKTHHIRRAWYTISAVIYEKLWLVAGLFYCNMAGSDLHLP